MDRYVRIGIVCLICGGILCSARPAYAYLDPNTGNILLQAAIFLFTVGMLGLKLFWTRIRQFFSIFQKRNHDETSSNDEE